MTIQKRVEQITANIQDACNNRKRLGATVCPVVVTKNRSQEEVQTMYDLGFRHFAENRVEKLLERQGQFPQEDIVWHLIGPLQKRKVKEIVNRIDYFHALDRVSIMDEINKRLTSLLDCFLEVNVSGEESKHGFKPQEVFEAYEASTHYPNIHIVGLMTMAPFDAMSDELHHYFHALRELADVLQKERQLEESLQLSMGMSHDYKEAIEEGATFVRIGTAWFEEEE